MFCSVGRETGALIHSSILFEGKMCADIDKEKIILKNKLILISCNSHLLILIRCPRNALPINCCEHPDPSLHNDNEWNNALNERCLMHRIYTCFVTSGQ